MNNKVPGFTDQEWELMKDYIDNSGKEPRQNLIELISHVDPSVAQLGMNSGPYFMLDRLLTDEQIDFANHLKLRVPVYIDELAEKSGKGRRLTKEEYMAKLKEAEDRGFVHNVSNHDGPSPIEYICNCDYQTCLSIRSSNYTRAANLQKSNFVATVDAEKVRGLRQLR